jgi:hypothetical protein
LTFLEEAGEHEEAASIQLETKMDCLPEESDPDSLLHFRNMAYDFFKQLDIDRPVENPRLVIPGFHEKECQEVDVATLWFPACLAFIRTLSMGCRCPVHGSVRVRCCYLDLGSNF